MNATSIGPRRDAGFTLLELLVAAAILTLIAVFSWRGLDALLREREVIASSQDVLDSTSRAFARIERDALLARDAALTDDGELQLVSNPAAEEASAAVAYRLRDGELLRTVNDGSAPIVLMSGITAGTFDLWVAGPNGGWTRSKTGIAEPLVAPTAPGGATATTAATANDGNVAATPSSAAFNNGNVAAVAPGAPGQALPATTQPPIATGLRIVLARADGTSLVRVFIIGSGG